MTLVYTNIIHLYQQILNENRRSHTIIKNNEHRKKSAYQYTIYRKLVK